jgi:hypothetical protein
MARTLVREQLEQQLGQVTVLVVPLKMGVSPDYILDWPFNYPID